MNTLFRTVTASNDDADIVSITPAENTSQKIFIKGLALEMFIGVFDSEKSQKQRVIVDLEVSVLPTTNWRSDDIKNVLSYAEIIEKIESLAQSGHINLVETFAERIVEICFTYSQVIDVSVSVQKPDVMEQGCSVGASIQRSRG